MTIFGEVREWFEPEAHAPSKRHFIKPGAESGGRLKNEIRTQANLICLGFMFFGVKGCRNDMSVRQRIWKTAFLNIIKDGAILQKAVSLGS